MIPLGLKIAYRATHVHTPPPVRSSRPTGFTLLETAITLLIVALLVAGVFGILQSSLQLADTIRGEQAREVRIQKFVEFCETTFNRLPADAMISVRPQKGFGNQSQMLEIANALSPFDAATPGTVSFTMEDSGNGTMRVILSYEENPVNFASSARLNTTRPVQVAVLEEVTAFQWRAFDTRLQEWITKWNEKVTAADVLKEGSSLVPAAGLPPTGQNLALNPETGDPSAVPPVAPAVGPDGQPIPGTPAAAAAPSTATSRYPRPPMLELIMESGGDNRRWIFWVPASVSPM